MLTETPAWMAHHPIKIYNYTLTHGQQLATYTVPYKDFYLGIYLKQKDG